MNPILISPQITSDKPIAEQLQQMKSYLFRFKEEVELLLSNIDSDNLSEKFEDDFSKVVGSKIMGSNEMSQIIQSAGQIKLSVADLERSQASLTLTVNGISAEVFDEYGNSRIDQNADEIALRVKRGTNYSGLSISSSGITISTSGNVDINADVIVNGTITAAKFQKDGDGYSIIGDADLGDITVNDIVTLGTSSVANFFTTNVSYLNASRNVSVTQNISCGGSCTVGSTLVTNRVETTQLEFNGDDVGIYYIPDGNGNTVCVLGTGYVQ